MQFLLLLFNDRFSILIGVFNILKVKKVHFFSSFLHECFWEIQFYSFYHLIFPKTILMFHMFLKVMKTYSIHNYDVLLIPYLFNILNNHIMLWTQLQFCLFKYFLRKMEWLLEHWLSEGKARSSISWCTRLLCFFYS